MEGRLAMSQAAAEDMYADHIRKGRLVALTRAEYEALQQTQLPEDAETSQPSAGDEASSPAAPTAASAKAAA